MFGYDFMVDTNYKVWLLEVNSSPSMDYSTVYIHLSLACDYKTSQGGSGRYSKVDHWLRDCSEEVKKESGYWKV
jgi:hypothetical protein